MLAEDVPMVEVRSAVLNFSEPMRTLNDTVLGPSGAAAHHAAPHPVAPSSLTGSNAEQTPLISG
jgi:hypothetical protein